MKFKLAIVTFFLTLSFVSGLGLYQIKHATPRNETRLSPRLSPGDIPFSPEGTATISTLSPQEVG